jgi:RimJ/RimL family protein N-acetyltransferase
MIHSLTTKRLVLSPLTEKDWDFVLSLFSRPVVHQFEQGPLPTQQKIREQFDRVLEKSALLPQDGCIWFIIHTTDNLPIGQIKLSCNWPDVQEWELGYALLPEYWGKGYASEASEAVLYWAFTHLHVHKVIAIINAENTKSVALARKIGMIEEGHMREARKIQGQYYDEKVFAMLASDLAHSSSD